MSELCEIGGLRLLLAQPRLRHSVTFQNWPGWAGGLGQSDRRL